MAAKYVESFIPVGEFEPSPSALVLSDESSDTLLRHTKTHRMQSNGYGTSLIGYTYAYQGNQRTTSLSRGLDVECNSDPSTAPVRAPLQASSFDAACAASGLSNASAHERSVEVLPSSSFQLSSNDVNAQPSMNDGFDRRTSASALIDSQTDFNAFSADNVPSVSASTLDEATFGAPFDATNWLLDESFFDAEGMDFLWNESSNGNDTLHLGIMTSTIIDEESDKPPRILDLRKMWYNQVQSAIDDLNSDGEKQGRQNFSAQQRSIDESYRTNMADELSPRLVKDQLPSFDFLVSF